MRKIVKVKIKIKIMMKTMIVTMTKLNKLIRKDPDNDNKILIKKRIKINKKMMMMIILGMKNKAKKTHQIEKED